jgi:hypothetical protein
VDTATQYEAKLQLMEEVVEYKERELWNMRREAEKRTGLNIDDCSVEELEELESELLKALVRIKTVKKKKAKEVRDSIKMDLLQVRTPSRVVCVCESLPYPLTFPCRAAAGRVSGVLRQHAESRVPPLRSLRGVRVLCREGERVPPLQPTHRAPR